MTQKWVVALFLDDGNEYSVVPTNWITQNESGVQFCKWPPGIVDSDVLQLASEPGSDWLKYRIKVYGGGKTYGKHL